MKRLIAIICSLFLIVCYGIPMFVFADDAYITDGYGTTVVTYTQPSDYCIIIPETIDASAGAYIFQAASLNISLDECVYVTVSNADENNRITFTHEGGTYTLAKQIITENVSGHSIRDDLPRNCVGYFEPDESASAVSFSFSTMNYEYTGAPKAGNYTATVEFNIYLESNG